MAGRTYVALLRGINVGRAKRVPMAALRALVLELGGEDVRTLLNSGNVVFRGPRKAPRTLARELEEALERSTGVSARTVVLPASELARVVEENPLEARAREHPSRFLVAVPSRAADLARLAPLAGLRWRPEALAVGSRAAYLWCPGGVLDSLLAKELGRVLGDGVTSRNWGTLTKLAALAGVS